LVKKALKTLQRLIANGPSQVIALFYLQVLIAVSLIFSEVCKRSHCVLFISWAQGKQWESVSCVQYRPVLFCKNQDLSYGIMCFTLSYQPFSEEKYSVYETFTLPG
jgi:hypothetical protein